jgi:chaperonin GroES
MSKRIKPLFDRILIQKIKPEQRTKSGLFIPEKSLELNQGLVLEVGEKSVLKKGDTVLLPSFGGTSVKLDQEYFIFKDEDILAKLE